MLTLVGNFIGLLVGLSVDELDGSLVGSLDGENVGNLVVGKNEGILVVGEIVGNEVVAGGGWDVGFSMRVNKINCVRFCSSQNKLQWEMILHTHRRGRRRRGRTTPRRSRGLENWSVVRHK